MQCESQKNECQIRNEQNWFRTQIRILYCDMRLNVVHHIADCITDWALKHCIQSWNHRMLET